jgi:hypothetical protein
MDASTFFAQPPHSSRGNGGQQQQQMQQQTKHGQQYPTVRCNFNLSGKLDVSMADVF